MDRTTSSTHIDGQDVPSLWAPSGTLTIDTVAAHWASLQASLAAGPSVHIDLTGIERVDTAGVQLLLQARRVAAGAGHPVSVRGFSLPADSRRLLGMTEDAALAAQVTPADVTGQEG